MNSCSILFLTYCSISLFKYYFGGILSCCMVYAFVCYSFCFWSPEGTGWQFQWALLESCDWLLIDFLCSEVVSQKSNFCQKKHIFFQWRRILMDLKARFQRFWFSRDNNSTHYILYIQKDHKASKTWLRVTKRFK